MFICGSSLHLKTDRHFRNEIVYNENPGFCTICYKICIPASWSRVLSVYDGADGHEMWIVWCTSAQDMMSNSVWNANVRTDCSWCGLDPLCRNCICMSSRRNGNSGDSGVYRRSHPHNRRHSIYIVCELHVPQNQEHVVFRQHKASGISDRLLFRNLCCNECIFASLDSHESSRFPPNGLNLRSTANGYFSEPVADDVTCWPGWCVDVMMWCCDDVMMWQKDDEMFWGTKCTEQIRDRILTSWNQLPQKNIVLQLVSHSSDVCSFEVQVSV